MTMRSKMNPVRRALYLAAGLVSLALGVVGAFLPILPTVPFLLLAAFCFARGHPQWAERLYAHPRYGAAMRKWRDRRAIGRRAKVSAVLAMAFSAGIVWLTVAWPWPLAVTALLACTGTWLWTRPE